MRFFIPFIFVLILSCQTNLNLKNDKLQKKVDSLENIINNSYKPGFGELMGFIQNHHAKLWFAGKNKNWELASFEIHELKEALVVIESFHKARKETALMKMINPNIDSLVITVEKKDKKAFKNTFKLLTKTCNSCHEKTSYDFIRIKVPEISMFRNQEFSLE